MIKKILNWIGIEYYTRTPRPVIYLDEILVDMVSQLSDISASLKTIATHPSGEEKFRIFLNEINVPQYDADGNFMNIDQRLDALRARANQFVAHKQHTCGRRYVRYKLRQRPKPPTSCCENNLNQE